jgi:hypothetical protein
MDPLKKKALWYFDLILFALNAATIAHARPTAFDCGGNGRMNN